MQPGACLQKKKTPEAAYCRRTSSHLGVGKLGLVVTWALGLNCVPKDDMVVSYTPEAQNVTFFGDKQR